jgi:hypothetical protein
MTIPPLKTLLRRPGTQLLAIVIADTGAFVLSHAGNSTLTVLAYFLQMLLVYRVWQGSNMVTWLLLALMSVYEAMCVYVVVSKGAAWYAPQWVAAHSIAVVVTGLVLFSPDVRERLVPLRGPKSAKSK